MIDKNIVYTNRRCLTVKSFDMDKVHNLMEITQAFDSPYKSLKEGKLGKGADVRLFNDVGLSLSQAMVISWLLNHSDCSYSTQEMASELHMEESRLGKILDDLYGYGFLEKRGEDIDVIDQVFFRILDFQAMRECGTIKDWRDYVARELGCYDWENNKDKEESTPHIIGTPDYLSGVNLEDEDALENMEDFDPIEGDDEDGDDEFEDPDDYDD